jgi:hypothetical protein
MPDMPGKCLTIGTGGGVLTFLLNQAVCGPGIPALVYIHHCYLLDWKRDSAEKGLGLAAGGRLKGLAVAAGGGRGGANIGGGNGCVVGCRG